MKPKIAALLVAAVVLAMVIGARLGGWGDKSMVGETPAPVTGVVTPESLPPTPAPVTPVVTPPAPVAPPAPPPAVFAKPATPAASAPPAAPAPKATIDDIEQARQDIDKVSLMLRDFRTIMTTNPVGTNAEIMHQINGGNPKGARLMHEGQQLNGNGELIDQWGTAYFFHQQSGTNMEIKSAGPDKIFGTPDDINGH